MAHSTVLKPVQSAAIERIAPVGVGGLVAAAAVSLAPRSADESFFSVSAQVLPVILLALVIEVRVVGTRVLHGRGEMTGLRVVEYGRRLLEFVLVVALLAAEAHALYVVGDQPSGSADPVLVWPGLVWGFTTVAVFALFGTRRARPELQLASEKAEDGVVLTITVGWMFVDKRVPLTAGDWGYLHYLIDPGGHATGFEVVVHLDHPELPGGRCAESMRVAW